MLKKSLICLIKDHYNIWYDIPTFHYLLQKWPKQKTNYRGIRVDQQAIQPKFFFDINGEPVDPFEFNKSGKLTPMPGNSCNEDRCRWDFSNNFLDRMYTKDSGIIVL